MLHVKNKILTNEGYRRLDAVKEGTRLIKGRIYDIFFVNSALFYSIGFCNSRLQESSLTCSGDIFLLTPEGRLKVSDIKIGDRIVTYNAKDKIEEVKSITKVNKNKIKDANTAIIITTEQTYIVEGFIISNDRLL